MVLLVLTLYRRSADRFIYFFLTPSPYRAVNTFHLSYKNQSVYAVSGTSRCLFWDKYKTHKYSVGRAYSCWMLNWWCITWPIGFKRLRKEIFSVTIKRHVESVKIRTWNILSITTLHEKVTAVDNIIHRNEAGPGQKSLSSERKNIYTSFIFLLAFKWVICKLTTLCLAWSCLCKFWK